MRHHRIAFLLVAVVAVLTVADGIAYSVVEHIAVWHGVYCIWMTEITVGGDVAPVSWGYDCLAFAPFPLLAAALTLFTSALAGQHVRKASGEVRSHVTTQCDVGKQYGQVLQRIDGLTAAHSDLASAVRGLTPPAAAGVELRADAALTPRKPRAARTPKLSPAAQAMTGYTPPEETR